MRVQCDVCEKALAEVVCCADEAALCLSCDQRVHAANKLASKHHRLRLLHNHPSSSSNPSPLPLCDICQEKGAFIFCLEDRALVCRDCDVCIHAANTLAAGHQRFLATGVQVALESEPQHADEGTHSTKPEAPRPQPPSGGAHGVSTFMSNSALPTPSSQTPSKECEDAQLLNSTQTSSTHVEEWQNMQNLDLTHIDSGYPLTDIDFSKTECDQDWLADLCVFDEHVYAKSPAEVPQASSPIYTSSTHGLESSTKGKQRRDSIGALPGFEDVCVVPDLMPIASYAPLAKRQKGVFGI